MNFNDYMNAVLTSTDADWNVATCWGAGAGPSYRNKLDIVTFSGDAGNWRLDVTSHSLTAALRSNLSITIAWGITANDDFKEDWANSFPDAHATSHYVDFFFNGALVYRALYLTVDGGRAKLPLPESDHQGRFTPRTYATLCRLLVALEGTQASEVDKYLRTAQIRETKTRWPE